MNSVLSMGLLAASVALQIPAFAAFVLNRERRGRVGRALPLAGLAGAGIGLVLALARSDAVFFMAQIGLAAALVSMALNR